MWATCFYLAPSKKKKFYQALCSLPFLLPFPEKDRTENKHNISTYQISLELSKVLLNLSRNLVVGTRPWRGCVRAKIWHNEAERRDKRIEIIVFPKNSDKASFRFCELDMDLWRESLIFFLFFLCHTITPLLSPSLTFNSARLPYRHDKRSNMAVQRVWGSSKGSRKKPRSCLRK